MQTNEGNPPIVIKPDSHCVVTTASSHLHFAFDKQLAKLCTVKSLERSHELVQLLLNTTDTTVPLQLVLEYSPPPPHTHTHSHTVGGSNGVQSHRRAGNISSH